MALLNKSKDFTDYDGKKRKFVLSGQNKEEVRGQATKRKDKEKGIKSYADLMKEYKKQIKLYTQWLKEEQKSSMGSIFCRWKTEILENYNKKLNKLEVELKKKGLYEKVTKLT